MIPAAKIAASLPRNSFSLPAKTKPEYEQNEDRKDHEQGGEDGEAEQLKFCRENEVS